MSDIGCWIHRDADLNPRVLSVIPPLDEYGASVQGGAKSRRLPRTNGRALVPIPLWLCTGDRAVLRPFRACSLFACKPRAPLPAFAGLALGYLVAFRWDL